MKKLAPFNLRNLFAGVALATLTAPSLSAAVLVNYSFTGGSAAPTTEAAEVIGSTAAWVGLTNTGFSSSSGTAFVRADSAPASFSAGQYFEFTITANSGYVLNLDNLVFDLGGTNTSGTLTYTVNTNVRSNLDAFGSNLTINPGATPTASHTVPFTTTNYSNFTTDLTGSQYDNLTAITFHLYPSDTSSSNTNFFRYDNITLNGTVTAVPEPTATMLLTVPLMGLMLFRRFPFQARSVRE